MPENQTAPLKLLSIEKEKSPLETQLIEIVDLKDLMAIENYVQQTKAQFNPNNFGEGEAIKYYTDVAHQMSQYKQLICDNTAVITYQKPKHGYGRVHPYKSLGLTAFKKNIRNALLGDRYCDFDLSNAQPEIVRNVCEANNISCPFIENYCDNRDEVLEDLSTKLECSRGDAKKLMLRLCFFGTYGGWVHERTDGKSHFEPQFITSFTEELNQIALVIKKSNPKLYEFARKKQAAEKKKNYLGCMFAFYLQEIELRIVQNVITHLIDKTKLTCHLSHKKVVSYEYDGFKLLKSNVEEFGGEEKVIELLNSILAAEGWNMNFDVKKIESDIVLADYYTSYIESIDPTGYNYIKKEYEEKFNLFKIVSSGTYCFELDGKLIFKNEKGIKECLRHITYKFINTDFKVPKAVEAPFIYKWIDDPKLRKYNNVGVYPPHCIEECPITTYNLWTPFYAETITNYKQDDAAVKMFRDHVMTLCNDNQETFEYVEMWLAQFFQHPGRKSGKMLLFMSGEGGGKGSMIRMLKRILGKERVAETANANDLIGQFNALLSNKYLVCFNEISKGQIGGNAGKMREAITDDSISITRKGVDPVFEESFHRFIGETDSKLNPVHTRVGDRRFVIINSSDRYKGNAQYFDKYYEMMASDHAIASIYHYYMDIPDVDRFYKMKSPLGDHQESLQEMNTEKPVLFYEYFVFNLAEFNISDAYGEPLEMFSKDLYVHFSKWRKDHGFEEFNTTAQKLQSDLFTSDLPGVSRGTRKSRGVPLMIDYKAAIKFYRAKYNKNKEVVQKDDRAAAEDDRGSWSPTPLGGDSEN
jgi:hypothetical protein